ncbi:MAG TPA: PH domain-containing protein [Candidatus Saccharimonadales bacterium]|nr:PH domain-containing protein [Candidatus Saccharimonadales bacterium]
MDEVEFRGKRPDEQVALVAKCHPWLLIGIPICWLILILLVVAVFWFFGASRTGSISVISALIIGGLYTLYQAFLWNNGLYIITDQRVIKIDQINLFKRLISETELDRIQEITTEIAGPIHTLLNFGKVKIKTASSDSGQMDLEDVADPYDLQQQIVQAQHKLRANPSVRPVRQV